MSTTSKDISYLGKDFGQFRKNLINFTKQYFPDTYTDFNESDPGMLFIEMAAYVGDVLSFYTDTNLKESFLHQASEASNIYDISRMLGYNVKNVTPSLVTLDVYQLLPAIGSGVDNKPDYTYALNIKPGMIVKQNNGNAKFRTIDPINFIQSSKNEVSVYESNPTTNEAIYYLIKTTTKAVSGDIRTATFTFNDPIPYDKIVLPDSNIIEIISVIDSDNNVWYEVPYLAQDTIFESIPNVVENNPTLSAFQTSAPSLLKLKKTSKRFVSRLRSDQKFEIQFGSGVSADSDLEIIPNPNNVGNGLLSLRKDVDINIDPSNFLYTKTYGQAPSNTTLTITYSVGNGISDNVTANTITDIDSVEYIENVNTTLLGSVYNFVKSTLAVNNTTPAVGAKTIDSLEDIKNNAIANFSTQNRLVTREDYVVRCYSMPSRFGSVSKAYVIPDDQVNQKQVDANKNLLNPSLLNLYVLGYNDLKQLTYLNTAIKTNLGTYLDQYRMITDSISIKNAFIINIGITFKITVLPKYNSNEVLLNCISELKLHFDIDNWQINQPILKYDVLNIIGRVKGVQSVIDVSYTNLFDTTTGYSGNKYDLTTATRNNIIYPSLDPSIFEIKFPNTDIKGEVISF
jgi:hypothetical protein